MEKLGIVIPYRDRKEHLDVFLPYMREFLNKKGLSDYEFFVVEQDDSELFNRGLLLNCGFTKANARGCNRVCFHDVDLLPVESDLYSLYPEEPIELVRIIEGSSELLPYNYFGGVTLVSSEDFQRVNGYSNWYAGWGFEDDDFLLRCTKAKIGRTFKKVLTPNSEGSAIHFEESGSITEELTIQKKGMLLLVVDFIPEYPKTGIGLQDMVVASLQDPLTGQKTSISYDKFNCYRTTVWNKNWHMFSIVSGKAPLIHSKCVLAIDRAKKTYSFYWNGKCLGKQELRSSELCVCRDKKVKLTIGENFRGSILEAGCYIFQNDLSDEDLSLISLQRVDLEGWDENTFSHRIDTDNPNFKRIWISSKESVTLSIPPRAEVGTFRALGHKGNNIIIDGHYLPEICKNQERFYAQARREAPEEEDGLSTLYLWNKTVVKNPDPDVTWIKVKKRG